MDVRAAKEAIERAGDGGDDSRMHFLLWKASGDARHIKAAKLHLDFQVEHAPEECRESMLKNVRLHREIVEAWEEHGAKIEKEPCG